MTRHFPSADMDCADPLDRQNLLTMRLKALKINEALGSRSGMAGDCCRLAELYLLSGKADLAENMLARAMEIERTLDPNEHFARHCADLGALYLSRGAVAKAEGFLKKSVGINEALNNLAGLAKNLQTLTEIAERQKDLEAVETLLLQTLQIARKLGDPGLIADTLGRIGATHLRLGLPRPAKRALEEAREFYLVIKSETGIADTLGHLGLAHTLLDDAAGAEAFLLQALQMNEALQRSGRLADNCGNLGNLHWGQGRRQAALPFYRRALALFIETGDTTKARKTRRLLNGVLAASEP
jgi:tetratricopeptide (TPR) repeat protein